MILARLTMGTARVGELLDEIHAAPNLLSYHLRVLLEATPVQSTRRGRRIDHHLNSDALARLHAAIPAPPVES